jgi:hypothetical protein
VIETAEQPVWPIGIGDHNTQQRATRLWSLSVRCFGVHVRWQFEAIMTEKLALPGVI